MRRENQCFFSPPMSKVFKQKNGMIIYSVEKGNFDSRVENIL